MDKKPLIVVSILAVVLLLITSMDCTVSADQIRNHSMTIEIIGQNIQPQRTIMVSDIELLEIEQVFTDVSEDLASVSSPEDKLQVYWNAIYRLHDLGVLGNLSCEDAYQLATRWYRPSISLPNQHSLRGSNNTNSFCLISGRVNYSMPSNRFSNFLEMLLWVYLPVIPNFSSLLLFILYMGVFMVTAAFSSFLQHMIRVSPIALGNIIGIGAYGYTAKPGWIKTDGLYGTKNWNGNLNGALPGYIWNGFIYYYQAISGFCGIKILNDNSWVGYDASYLGSALLVGINASG